MNTKHDRESPLGVWPPAPKVDRSEPGGKLYGRTGIADMPRIGLGQSGTGGRGRTSLVGFAVLLSVASVGVEHATRIFETMLSHHVSSYWFAAYLLLASSLIATEIGVRNREFGPSILSFALGLPICLAFVVGFAQYAPLSLLTILMSGLGLCGLSPFVNLAALCIQGLALRSLPLDCKPRRGVQIAAWAAFALSTLLVLLMWHSSPIWPSGGARPIM